MTRDKENSLQVNRKLGKDQQLLEAARLGQFNQLESILSELQAKSKKRSNPLASLRKCLGPNSIRDSVTGFTCLHHAALNGHSQCVQLILDYGAKVNAVDYKGSSALHLASWAGNLQVVKILLSLTAANQQRQRQSLLVSQSSSSSSSSVAIATTTTTTTPVNHNATGEREGYQEIDVDLRNNDKQTPLSLAAQFGHNEVVGELLAAGASVHLRNGQLESPLDLASLNGRLETVRLLLEARPELQLELRQPRAVLHAHHCSSPAAAPAGQRADTGTTTTTTTTSSQQQQKRAPDSGGGWSSLLRPHKGTSAAKETTSQSSSCQQQSLQQQQQQHQRRRATLALESPSLAPYPYSHSPSGGPILLDHSPIHYATRRGHLQVLTLLLDRFEANLMQLTTVGSVLHELAISSCQGSRGPPGTCGGHSQSGVPIWRQQHQQQQQSDLRRLLALLFGQLGCRAQGDQQLYLAEVNKFLNLRDGRERTVFQLLNEINTRPAQELSQMIYEHCSSIGSIGSISGNSRPQEMAIQAAGAPMDTSMSEAPVAPTSQQQQRHEAVLFSDSTHINSFVTMKRLPKHGRHQPNSSNNNNGNGGQPVMSAWSGGQQISALPSQLPAITSTQTIDRRRRRDASDQNRSIPVVHWPQNQSQLEQQQQHLYRFESLDASQRPPAPVAGLAMTRSVSNLIHGSNGVDDRQLQPLAEGQMIGGQWAASSQDGKAQDQGYQQQQQQQQAKQSKKKRSKSRDLGSLLLEAQQQQQQQQHQLKRPDPQTDPLYDDETTFQASQPDQQQQQQQQSDLPSLNGDTHPLVRSQTDCSHLMGRLFGQSSEEQYQQQQQQQQRLLLASLGQTRLASRPYAYPMGHRLAGGGGGQLLLQQQDLGLDRKAINRRYHVYEHEFYPPRLINQLDGRQLRQAVAVVPPLNRSESTGATSSSSCSFKAASYINQPDGHQSAAFSQQQQQQQLDLATTEGETRSSLGNLQPSELVVQQQQQQLQMDRFLNRHSLKKSANDQLASGSLDNRASEQLDISIQQQNIRLIQQQQQQQQQQQLQLQSSHSLESHLSEPHLFETTRRALMRDFDQMIGRELLGGHQSGGVAGDHQLNQGPTSIGSSASASSSSGARSPQQPASILTGVSLDMDNRGECLTVSGTRIILPTMARQPRQQSANSSQEAASQALPQASAPQRPPRPSAAGAHGANGQRLNVAGRPRPLSSASMHVTSGSSSNNSPKPIIYDLPLGDQRPGSRTSVQVAASLVSTPMAGAGCKLTPGGQQRGNNCAITRPPQERPPPPPTSSSQSSKSQLVGCPIATGAIHGDALQERQQHHQQQQQLGQGLLKMGSISSTTSATSSTSTHSASSVSVASSGYPMRYQPDTGTLQKQCIQIQPNCSQQQQQQLPPAPPSSQSIEFDSGVCTSNSPSSIMSHDSETAARQPAVGAADGGGPNDAMAQHHNSTTAAAATTTTTTSVGCVGGGGGQSQMGDGDSQLEANESVALGKRRESSTNAAAAAVPLAPPSPQTAQLCIEEALFPLEKVSAGTSTSEAANQTQFGSAANSSPPSGRHRRDLNGCSTGSSHQHHYSVDAVVGWLGKTTAPSGRRLSSGDPDQNNVNADDGEPVADYENCSALQLQLQARSGSPKPSADHRAHSGASRLMGPNRLALVAAAAAAADASSSNTRDVGEDYEDYAAATSDDSGPSSRASHSPSSSLEFSRGSLGQYENADLGTTNRQVGLHLLKLVIDEPIGPKKDDDHDDDDKAADEEGVFYLVRPSELERISSAGLNGRAATIEAATITDEELSVEPQGSGLIRFTLRKRRDLMKENTLESTRDQPPPPDTNCDTIQLDNASKTTTINGLPAERSERAIPQPQPSPTPPTTTITTSQQFSTIKRTKLNETANNSTAATSQTNITNECNNSNSYSNNSPVSEIKKPTVVQSEQGERLSRQIISGTNHRPAKQMSLDSSDSPLGPIQASTISSTSSSSSKESIKSIVSLNKQPATLGAASTGGHSQEGGNHLPQSNEMATLPVGGKSTTDVDSSQPQQQQLKESSNQRAPVKCAIVSETARRFETSRLKPAHHQQQNQHDYQPVPALRRSQRVSAAGDSRRALTTDQDDAPSASLGELPQAPVKPLANAKPTGNKLDNIRQQFEQTQGIKLRPVQPVRKTVCWPPTKATDTAANGNNNNISNSSNSSADQENGFVVDNTKKQCVADQQADEENKRPLKEGGNGTLPPVMSRVSANRLSFQRMIEENNNNNNNYRNLTMSTASKPPKPAPPTKPAHIQMVTSRLDGLDGARNDSRWRK